MISKTSTTENEIQYLYVPESITIGRFNITYDNTKPGVVTITITARMIDGKPKRMTYDVDVVKFQNALECLWE